MSGNSDKRNKIYFIDFKSKKISGFESAADICTAFGKGGYFFDKASFVAYDDPREIAAALGDGLNRYENLIILCPKSMELTLKNFIAAATGGVFAENALKTEYVSVYMLFSEDNNVSNCNRIVRELDEKYGLKFKKSYIKTVGATVDQINGAFLKAKEVCPDSSARISESFGDSTLEITCPADLPQSEYDKMNRIIVAELNEYIYAFEDVPLAARLVELLKLRRKKIAVAESFTGGGVGKRIVEIPGASEVYSEGLNTYSNASKTERLGVSKEILRKHGAVSKETAFQMARGLLKKGHCDLAVATTGIAGPKSDETNKPVGLLYIAVGQGDNISVYEYNLKGDRRQITETAINYALFLSFKSIK